MTIFRRPCLHTEGNHAQLKPTIHFRVCYTSMRIRGPTSRSKIQANNGSPRENTLSTKPKADTRIQGQNDMLNPLNIWGTPRSQHRTPTGSPQIEDGTRWPQKGVGRTPRSPDPLLGLIRPIFLLQTPTASPTPAPDGTTSKVHPRIHSWRAI